MCSVLYLANLKWKCNSILLIYLAVRCGMPKTDMKFAHKTDTWTLCLGNHTSDISEPAVRFSVDLLDQLNAIR